MTKYKLEPCPCCGSPAEFEWEWSEDLWSHETVKWYKIRCTECGVMTESWPESVVDRDVVPVWNRRVKK